VALFVSCITNAEAQTANLFIKWEGKTIRLADDYSGDLELSWKPPGPKSNIFDCVFDRQKTKCYRYERVSGVRPYGTGWYYVKPIAIFPGQESNAPLTKEEEESTDPWAYRHKRIRSLRSLSETDVINWKIEDMISQRSSVYGMTEVTDFVPIEHVLGGQRALNQWRSSVGILPKNECVAEESCGVFVEGRIRSMQAIAYCSIQNSEIGVGLPYNCDLVAIEKPSGWHVVSQTSPEQCDGCGAGAGASCSAETEVSLEDAVDIFQNVMRQERTNIDLKLLRKTDTKAVLAGKNIASPSKFFRNYYDLSYGSYTVSVDFSNKKRIVDFSGVFNLLISAERSSNSIDYREIGSRDNNKSSIVWFQEQVMSQIRDKVVKQIGKISHCEVFPDL
jgi:hypothetical protein